MFVRLSFNSFSVFVLCNDVLAICCYYSVYIGVMLVTEYKLRGYVDAVSSRLLFS